MDPGGWVHIRLGRTPSTPTNVQASDGTYTDKVRVTWTGSSGATGYEVYRAASSTGSRSKLGSAASSTYDDTTAEYKTYYVRNETTGDTVVRNAGEVYGYVEGPLFDGMRLLIDDLEAPRHNAQLSGWETGMTTADLREFREAVIRLKVRDGLYKQEDYGVAFVGGASLFRTTIDLPANIPVGTLTARVFLFRGGQVLDRFETQVRMQREGIERILYDFAFGYPLIYGIVAVLIAAGAGLAASSYFGRRRG